MFNGTTFLGRWPASRARLLATNMSCMNVLIVLNDGVCMLSKHTVMHAVVAHHIGENDRNIVMTEVCPPCAWRVWGVAVACVATSFAVWRERTYLGCEDWQMSENTACSFRPSHSGIYAYQLYTINAIFIKLLNNSNLLEFKDAVQMRKLCS